MGVGYEPSVQCVAVCGGEEPQERLECEGVVCDMKEQQLHRARGCSPVTRWENLLSMGRQITSLYSCHSQDALRWR